MTPGIHRRLGRLRAALAAHREGMLFDLGFAVVWVAVVSALFGLLGAPTWATHLALFAGVLAYVGFVASLETARAEATG